jgi:nicotinate-nucleotide--dimethylbenzimidazole phosphoribosyltransferase
MPSDVLYKFRSLISELPLIDKSSAGAAATWDSVLTKPAGALGRLEDLAVWMSGWQGKHPPTYDAPQIVIFAGNHGVCDQGISAFPKEVTAQMVKNFQGGGAAINQLADAFGASFAVLPLALESPTLDFTKGPAMNEEECCEALQSGWDSVSQDTDLLVVGEMGIGNTTVAAAVSAAVFGGTGADWAGPGTGLTLEGVQKKAEVIDAGLLLHSEILNDPLLVLQHLGGREIAAMVGAILAARHNKIPVILDGFVVGAAAAVLKKANSSALDHCVAGHMSAEPGHELLLRHLEKEPLLTLRMRLGEGSGAALALGIIKGALATHNGMASFTDAGVSGESSS